MQTIGADAEKAQMNRSFLFVPADSERKMQKAGDTGADALILDLEDCGCARSATGGAPDGVRVPAGQAKRLGTDQPVRDEDAAADLEAVMPAEPAGIVLPKARSAADAIALSRRIDELEQRHGIEQGQTKIIVLCTERPAALFTLHGYMGATERLLGLSWGAEDLSVAVGASANRDEQGNWLPAFEMARSLCLLAAAAAEVTAIDTVFTDFRDAEGLLRYAGRCAPCRIQWNAGDSPGAGHCD